MRHQVKTESLPLDFRLDELYYECMKALLFLTLAVILSACGHEPKLEIDPTLQPYLDQWHADANSTLGRAPLVIDLVMKFGKIAGQGEEGECTIVDNGTPTITIDKDTWAIYDEAERLYLVYHELGHCILMRGHNDTMIALPNGNGGTYQGFGSIMNHASSVNEIYWTQNRQTIMNEYFQKGQ